ncbi:MAG: DNA repair protein RecN [Geminicoccaceae bacterium]
MLQSLSIRDLVLIDRLELDFASGLGVLTGETGAGKSILLDALSLVLGRRVDRGLIRTGAEKAQVTAVFRPGPDHPAQTLLAEAEIETEPDQLILQRIVQADGRSKALANSQPIASVLLRKIGASLVEIHGQNDSHGLLDRATHKDLLDAFGDHGGLRSEVADRYASLVKAADRHRALADKLAAARTEEHYLRHRLAELDQLDPQIGEEEKLADKRQSLMAQDRLVDGLDQAMAAIEGQDGALARLVQAERALERLAGQAGGFVETPLSAVARARLEVEEARSSVAEAARALDADEQTLEQVETRLFEIRAMARKHRVQPDQLAELQAETRADLDALDAGGDEVEQAAAQVAAAEVRFRDAVRRLRDRRKKAANSLSKAVAAELPPLKLDRVRFEVAIEELDESRYGPQGGETVAFRVATNPGQSLGDLSKVASGGELSRLMLALKVVLARTGSALTLVFDEIDAGIGGATADAVGERLAVLARDRQTLVVTHAPQVAARADNHMLVAKNSQKSRASVDVRPLDAGQRREEIARMLAGAEVTVAAGAAAASLLEAGV